MTLAGAPSSVQPYSLLLSLEQRALAATRRPEAHEGQGAEWVGVGVRLGSRQLLLARGDTREILVYPASITRVPGTKAWLRGLTNLRGQLLPVVDLNHFLGGTPSTVTRATRIVVASHRDIPAGLIVDEVHGFRRFFETEFLPHGSEQSPSLLFSIGEFVRDQEQWTLVNLRKLLESPEFSRVSLY